MCMPAAALRHTLHIAICRARLKERWHLVLALGQSDEHRAGRVTHLVRVRVRVRVRAGVGVGVRVRVRVRVGVRVRVRVRARVGARVRVKVRVRVGG